DNHPFLGMDDKQRAEMKEGRGLPEGSGWVIELRGFTYFWDSPQFVMQTLVKEIARKGAGPAADQGAGGSPAQPAADAPASAPSAPAIKDSTKPAGNAPDAAKPDAAKTNAAKPEDAKSEDKQEGDEATKEKPPARDPAKEKETGWNNVIRGHVSHPFIYLY